MARMQFQHVPLAKWPREETPAGNRRGALFKSKLTASLKLLAAELAKLGAINPILLTTDHQGDKDLGIDGMPRNDLKQPNNPGVVIEFYAFRHGKQGEREKMQFACDTYQRWQHNVHAIVLTLTALRAIDRYGATSAGEQYAGFKALPAPAKAMTVEAAAQALASIAGPSVNPRMVIDGKQIFLDAYRVAAKKAHPDTGGTAASWETLQSADSVLRAHHHL